MLLCLKWLHRADVPFARQVLMFVAASFRLAGWVIAEDKALEEWPASRRGEENLCERTVHAWQITLYTVKKPTPPAGGKRKPEGAPLDMPRGDKRPHTDGAAAPLTGPSSDPCAGAAGATRAAAALPPDPHAAAVGGAWRCSP